MASDSDSNEPQYHNVVVVEFLTAGEHQTLTVGSETEQDSATAIAISILEEHGVVGESVTRLYSERQPTSEDSSLIAERFPNAAVTWSFDHGEDEEMARAIRKHVTQPYKRWWQFWR